MGISRRWFIGGAASFGAFGGARLFAADGLRPTGRPNLTFGVVSDIHVSRMAGDPEKDLAENTETFRKTLVYFRDAGVDAVVIAGDMADNGVIAQLETVAAVWRDVFPDDRAPDGRRVERLFVYGNHDMGGIPVGRGRLKGMADDEILKRIIFPDPKAAWERVFGEPFEPIWKKQVKGYSFVGAQWLTKGCRGKDEAFNGGVADFYAQQAKSFDPKLPVFHIQHPHPKDTCYGPWAWGRDVGLSTKALSSFPNAIAFSGHSHYSLTDERSVWQGAFTSVGTSSLRYLDYTYNETEVGFENSVCDWSPNSWRINAEKMTPRQYPAGRQGMVWRVYGDCLAVERRDFMFDQSLGPDWILPLEASEPRPFAFAEHARRYGVPSFAEGASLAVARVRAKNRGGKTKDQEVAAVERAAIKVTIPPVRPDANARAHLFEVTAVAGGVKRTKCVMVQGNLNAVAHHDAKKPTVCLFAEEEFPKGEKISLTVTPVNCFQKRGEPLKADI